MSTYSEGVQRLAAALACAGTRIREHVETGADIATTTERVKLGRVPLVELDAQLEARAADLIAHQAIERARDVQHLNAEPDLGRALRLQRVGSAARSSTPSSG